MVHYCCLLYAFLCADPGSGGTGFSVVVVCDGTNSGAKNGGTHEGRRGLGDREGGWEDRESLTFMCVGLPWSLGEEGSDSELPGIEHI